VTRNRGADGEADGVGGGRTSGQRGGWTGAGGEERGLDLGEKSGWWDGPAAEDEMTAEGEMVATEGESVPGDENAVGGRWKGTT
jgi:hypothetical protein